jgi:hypothetical protein
MANLWAEKHSALIGLLVMFLFSSSLGYCYRGVSYKTCHALRPFYGVLCIVILVLIITDSSIKALWQIPAETPSSEGGRNLAIDVR